MGGTLSSFYIGVSGLQSNQYALNVTSHNLSNVNTKGHSRQQVLLTDMSYHRLSFSAVGINKSGLGTKIADVRLVRDTFADRAYRTEVGREQYYRTKYDVIKEVEIYFGEMESATFRDHMMNLWRSAEELQKESNSIVTRSSYIEYAGIFLEQANKIYDQLKKYQKNLNKEISDKVDEINKLADIIYELNDEILRVEAAGIESANDYRDLRDDALDKLSALIKISYEEGKDGTVEVYAENRCLVTSNRTYKLDVKAVSESCDYYKPVWADDGDDLFFGGRVPSAEAGSDVGSLKALLMSRGDFVANYTHIPKAPIKPKESDFAGGATDPDYIAANTKYANDLAVYEAPALSYQEWMEYLDNPSDPRFTDAAGRPIRPSMADYNKFIEPYTVNNMIAQFDQLIHSIVTTINDILCPNKEVIMDLNDGKGPRPVKILDVEKAGYGMGEGNQYQGTELFVRNGVPRYTPAVDANGTPILDANGNQILVYNEESPYDYYSMYTLGNMQINEELTINPSLLPLSNLQGEELQRTADQLLNVWKDKLYVLSPNTRVVNDFFGYYAEFTGDFANKGTTYYGIAETQRMAASETDWQRQQVSGVSSDEELANLVKFQQAYNASSRYFTVISEMTEHLIMRLGS